MSVRTGLVGLIRIDASAAATPLFERPRTRCRWNAIAPEEYAESITCAVLVADLRCLRQELECELQRLQARLAA